MFVITSAFSFMQCLYLKYFIIMPFHDMMHVLVQMCGSVCVHNLCKNAILIILKKYRASSRINFSTKF